MFAAHVAVLLVALAGTAVLPPLARGAASLRGLLDLSALRSPRFLAMTLVPVVGAVGFVTFLTYTPSALHAVYGIPVGATGLLMLAMTVPVLLAPTLVHRLLGSGRVTVDTLVLASFVLLGAGALGMLLLGPDLPLGLVVAPMVLLGLGFGLPLGFVDAEALAAVPAERVGAASGVINLFRIGSEALFVALYALIVSGVVTVALPGAVGQGVAAGAAGHPWAYHHGLVAAAATMAALVAAAAVAFALLKRAAGRTRDGAGRGAAAPSPEHA